MNKKDKQLTSIDFWLNLIAQENEKENVRKTLNKTWLYGPEKTIYTTTLFTQTPWYYQLLSRLKKCIML